MWPLKNSDKLSVRWIDGDFAVGGQVDPADIAKVKAAGFKSILCARPDLEEPGQPAFGLVAQSAAAAGIETVHIPVSGPLTEGALIRMEQALETLPRPILGYCRSGARAGSLYVAAMRARS